MTDSDDSDLGLSDEGKKRLARRSGIPPENGGYVPVEVLEDLAEELEVTKEHLEFKQENFPTGDYTEGSLDMANACLDKLTQVIETHGDGDD